MHTRWGPNQGPRKHLEMDGMEPQLSMYRSTYTYLGKVNLEFSKMAFKIHWFLTFLDRFFRFFFSYKKHVLTALWISTTPVCGL